jgi:hypothetical protein
VFDLGEMRKLTLPFHSVTNMARYWGQGVAGYGNDLKDAVGASGSRVAVAGNPLGLAGMGSGKAPAPGQKKVGGGGKSTGGSSASNPLGIWRVSRSNVEKVEGNLDYVYDDK